MSSTPAAPSRAGLVGASRRQGLRHLVWLASIELFMALGAFAILVAFVDAAGRDLVAIDLRQFYVAAEAILAGDDPYLETAASTALWGGPYPYPPLPALLATPLTLLPFQAAGLLVMALLVLVALAIPYLLGVRDWRCYGIMLVWPPTLSAIQTGNVTLWFALALAIAWRFRDRRLPGAAGVGATLAVKFFLWPVVVWLLATRRAVTAGLAVAVGAGLLLLSWAAIAFEGFTGYPALVRRLEDTIGEASYTAYVVGLDIGLPSSAARVLWLLIGVGLLALVVMLGRRGDDKAAFMAAIAAALAFAPIVWLHYFALLLVVVALAQPRFGILWFVPLGFVLTPGSGDATPFRTAWTLAVAAAIVGLALRAALAESRPLRSRASELLAVSRA